VAEADNDGGGRRPDRPLISLSAVISIIGTLLVALLGVGVQQLNQLRQDFDHDRLAARREYASDVAALRDAMHKDTLDLRSEFRDIILHERAETDARFIELSSRISDILTTAREVNRNQDILIDRLRERLIDERQRAKPTDDFPP
jgi:hypothetical protein